MAEYLFYAMFAAVFVSSFGIGIWSTIARARAARRMAARAGLNPQDAAATAMFTADGLDATYLVSATRPTYAAGSPAPQVSPTAGKTVEERLRELEELKTDGLISNDEYATQHKAIVSSI